MAAPASAADLAARPYKAAPIAAPMYDWSGFYIGANGGWGDSHNCVVVITVAAGTLLRAAPTRSGGVFGGQLGYRWQSSQWVFGLEAQGDWADLSIRASASLFRRSHPHQVDAVGLFTGQIGYAWNASLFYVKGGAATVTDNRFSISTNAGGVELAAGSSNPWGGTVGVGWEYGFAPNWSFGIEYDRLFMGDANNSFSFPTAPAGAFNRISQDVDMVTLRINYRFGGYGSPVVAKY